MSHVETQADPETPIMFTKLRQAARDARGNVAMIFALALIPFIIFAGLAVDYSQAVLVRTRLAHTLDALALAIGAAPGLSNADAQALGERFFEANFPASELGVMLDLDIVVTDETVSVTASAKVDTAFLHIIGADEIVVGEDVQVARGGEDLELVMVLDNTGSMSGSRIAALRDAAGDAVDILFDNAPAGGDRLAVGLVPFSSAVNVGTAYEGAWWMDPAATSPIHAPAQNFDRAVNRWELFDELRTNWAGCVEARPEPYDLEDEEPDAGRPETLFVPYFAPDEPGDAGHNNNGYQNSYLDDSGAGPFALQQAHADKYFAGGSPRSGGPNWGCTVQPIQPLTDLRDTLHDAVDAMDASGTTNIHNAVSWGVRVLSPEAPFDEGRDFGEDNLIKAMIVLTDGDNYIGTNTTHNQSHYTGYGFIAEERLGVASSNFNVVHARMNDKTEDACEIARDRGVRVYTITFEVRSATTRTLMEDCASVDENGAPLYWDSPDAASLNAAFRDIARDLSQLRISR